MESKAKMKVYRVELTEEDVMNIRKWLTATSMMIEAKLRTNYSDSERKTSDKILYAREA